MSRHSKHQNTRTFVSNAERADYKFGSQTKRFSGDNLKSFDCCTLCLHFAVNPVCCPDGHIFCKECIYENLLSQKKDVDRKTRDYEAQQKRKQSAKATEEIDKKAKLINDFVKKDVGTSSSTTSTSSSSTHSSFWVSAPESHELTIHAPSKDTLCPADLKKLRLKQLVSVNFLLSKDEKIEGRLFDCCMCLMPLTNISHPYVLPACGHVFCSTCMNILRSTPSSLNSTEKEKEKGDKITSFTRNQCYVCQKPFVFSAAVKLENGGTGFVANDGEKAQTTKQGIVTHFG